MIMHVQQFRCATEASNDQSPVISNSSLQQTVTRHLLHAEPYERRYTRLRTAPAVAALRPSREPDTDRTRYAYENTCASDITQTQDSSPQTAENQIPAECHMLARKEAFVYSDNTNRNISTRIETDTPCYSSLKYLTTPLTPKLSCSTYSSTTHPPLPTSENQRQPEPTTTHRVVEHNAHSTYSQCTHNTPTALQT
jgi:hypothetical protein